jgi:GDP-L-fucose synthase
MKKLFVAGHKGMVGSAVCRANSDYELITYDKKELNLKDQLTTDFAISQSKPDIVIICAAKVGGIHANNKYPADFIYDNLIIQFPSYLRLFKINKIKYFHYGKIFPLFK